MAVKTLPPSRTPTVCREPLAVNNVVDQPLVKSVLEVHVCSELLPALHISNDAKTPCVLHLGRKCAVRVEPHPDSARSDESWHRGVVVDITIVAMSKATMCIVALYVSQYCFVVVAAGVLAYPCIDTALGEQATVHLLPANTIMLNYRLVGDSESTTSGKAPICWVKSYRWLLKRLACAAKCKEAARR